MNLKENLEKYAELIVSTGLSIKPGDKLKIRVTEETLPLVRLVSKKAYERGALDVDYEFSDDTLTLDRYLSAPDEAFTRYPVGRIDFLEKQFKDGYNVLSLVAPNPELLKPVDSKRINLWQKTAGLASKRIQKYTMQNKVKWCVAGVACKAWAKAAFPKLNEAEAIEKLWENIFKACRVDLKDPIAAWRQHDQTLKAHKDFLNKAHFVKVHYKGPGTDLMVGLPEKHVWGGGSCVSANGDVFFPNMPTEEIFSMPDADHVDGTLAATMPLAVRGQIVDKFHFTFKDGKVVDYDAKVGKAILDGLLETDDGARRLGEIALVPHNSPISQTGILFKNTLFDENASCHFALGMAYTESLKGANRRSEEENRKLGMNNSLIHVDFMVGSEKVTVTGIKKDGTEVVLLKDGNWQI
ncbi:MAG TPA: aminopeptidase [Anaerolineaceae bacterium]|nr:aminopeptidase [Anaerolineaceae bacterium]